MKEDYLWDRTGSADEEVERLEKLLAPMRHRPVPPARRVSPYWLSAVAASVLLVVGAAFWMRPGPASLWRINGKTVALGKRIESGGQRVLLEALPIGEVQLEPQSVLRVVESEAGGQQLLSLERGTLHALIWAPPTRFVVATPSVRSIDLGCAYSLSVQPDGDTLLEVTSGWVAFQAGERESFIPTGAVCRTRPGTGPGLPYRKDAPANLQASIAVFDAQSSADAMNQIVERCRQEDSLTLWHLLLRTSGEQRRRVAARFVEFHPELELKGLEDGQAGSLDAAWKQLGYGDASWWRSWKHPWKQN